MKKIIAPALAVVTLMFATAGFAEDRSARARGYRTMDRAVEMLPDALLREAGVEETTIRRLAAKDIIGIPEIPREDFPDWFLAVEGTGDVRLSGTVPVPTPLPVIILVQRGNCDTCPYNLMTAVWTQSTIVDIKPSRIGWYRVEQVPDRLAWAYAGGFESPGTWNIKVVTFNPAHEYFMTETFVVETQVLDFWDHSCIDFDGNVRVIFHVQSLSKLENGDTVSIDIPGLGTFAEPARVLEATPREAEVWLSMPEGDYAFIAGLFLPVTVILPPASPGGELRTREKSTVFFPTNDGCDNPGKG